jgi:phosphomannomutase/phosphoglucomutase
MNLNPRIFREFSIRGIADQDLADDVVTALGWAIGATFTQRGSASLVVGRDARLSSPRLGQSLIAGLVQAGIHVTDVGIVPTPVHNFATDFFQADGGVMITASHNPAGYNGFKIRADRTLQGDDLQAIYRLAAAYVPYETVGAGHVRLAEALPAYLDCIKSYADVWRPLKVVVDAGNGTNGPIVPTLLRGLGCEVIELYCGPDGSFPNRDPDPIMPGALTALSALVRSTGADLGLAYDGDGDRLALVDEQGGPVLGDQILMLLARDALRCAPAKIVYEVLCSQALADDVRAHGGQPVMVACGYVFVHQAMRDQRAALGGEFSGHLFFDDPNFRFDDSILATIKLLNVVARRRHPLSALIAELPAYHSSPSIRLACPDEIKGRVVEQARRHYRANYPVDELDGARIDFGDGWALVRASNTQPALSLRFEARSAARLEQLQTQVMKRVEDWMAGYARAAQLAVVILAAGQGKRMKSALPKVLHLLAGRPLIQHVAEAVRPLNPARLVVVIGQGGDQVRAALAPPEKPVFSEKTGFLPEITFVEQAERRGTGHAVMQAEAALHGYQDILVLYGDMPLLRPATLQSLWDCYRAGDSPLAMLIVAAERSRGFGRVLRDEAGRIQAIVEEADCTPEQLAIRELNVGVYCFDAGWLWSHLPRLPLHADKGPSGEYFLTDLVAMAVAEGYDIPGLVIHDPVEALGVNTPEHLAEAEALLRASGGPPP